MSDVPTIDLSYVSPEGQKRLEAAWEESTLSSWMRERYPDRPDPDLSRRRVLATRRAARELIEAHPDVTGPVVLLCANVEVASTPFVDEILRAWPNAVWDTPNEDVREAIDLVRRHHGL